MRQLGIDADFLPREWPTLDLRKDESLAVLHDRRGIDERDRVLVALLLQCDERRLHYLGRRLLSAGAARKRGRSQQQNDQDGEAPETVGLRRSGHGDSWPMERGWYSGR